MAKRYDTLLRLILVGDTGTGKTCLICQYACNEFHPNHLSTIGVDFKMKVINLDGKNIKVQFWDTAGQERYEVVTKQSIRRTQGCVLVYDICSRSSFESLGKWLLIIKQHAPEDTSLILVGNKTDLERREVSRATAQQFADENNIKYYEVSAKIPESLNEPFEELCRDILNNSRQQLTYSESIDLRAPPQGLSSINNKAVQTEDNATSTPGRSCC